MSAQIIPFPTPSTGDAYKDYLALEAIADTLTGVELATRRWKLLAEQARGEA